MAVSTHRSRTLPRPLTRHCGLQPSMKALSVIAPCRRLHGYARRPRRLRVAATHDQHERHLSSCAHGFCAELFVVIIHRHADIQLAQRASIPRAYSRCPVVIGNTRTCSGASHTGNAPAYAQSEYRRNAPSCRATRDAPCKAGALAVFTDIHRLKRSGAKSIDGSELPWPS